MSRNRLLLFLLITLTVIASIYLDFKNEILNFCVGIIIVFYELTYLIIFKNRINKSKNRFSVKTYTWTNGIAFTAIMIFIFSDEHMDIWNIIAIVCVIVYGILFTLRNWRKNYGYDNQGFTDLNENKKISSDTITDLKLSDDSFAINTSKYQNELVVKTRDLKYPSWIELKSELIKIRKTWANNGEHEEPL